MSAIACRLAASAGPTLMPMSTTRIGLVGSASLCMSWLNCSSRSGAPSLSPPSVSTTMMLGRVGSYPSRMSW